MSYNHYLEGAILQLIDCASGLDDLARRLRAAYPPVIVDAIDRLEATAAITADQARRARGYVAKPRPNPDRELPIPHPVDADWRLRRTSQEMMAARLRAAATSGVLLLGVPTVHMLIASDMQSTLLDANPALSLPPQFICEDIGTAAPILSVATVAFADPPWYVPETAQFLWYAAASVTLEAPVYLSIPGELTRPGVADERRRLVEMANSFGLEVRNLERGALGYDSPPFEVASLAAAGLPGFSTDWRAGDLLTFRKVAHATSDRPVRPERPLWIERVLRGVRIRFKVRSAHHDGFDPIPHDLQLNGPVRKTVSARDPLLQRVDVWTSGNQIFECADPISLIAIADAVASGAEPVAMVESHLGRMIAVHERQLVDDALRRLLDIVDSDSTCAK